MWYPLIINDQFFAEIDSVALDSHREHGYLCLRGLVVEATLDAMREGWSGIVTRYAAELKVEADQYLGVISQWRDLWKEDRLFAEVLREILAPVAAASLELPGARLLHDHFIRKDGGGSNGVIPWHQDSMFWPVDRTGLSTWLALDPAQIDQGCLQVIAGSHLWPSDDPVDFMRDERDMAEHPVTWLPALPGDLVVLNSKTWHRSDAVQGATQRLAHIALWVPEQSGYAPSLADWHPLNNQIHVKEGELLNEDEFPVYGRRSMSTGSSQENAHSGVRRHSGMFNARARVEAAVRKELGLEGHLGELLSDQAARATLARRLESRGELPQEQASGLVDDVWISAVAYERHRSRNVFNDAYARWAAYWGTETNA